jgi:VanZ family protein
MIPTRGKKIAVLLVAVYWPVLFVLAHIRMPDIVEQVQTSDKTLHFLAYMLLVFLLWAAAKPLQKVVWSKPAVWWLLLILVGYGVVDEWLQGYTGRTPDVTDFLADLSGTTATLILLSVLDFWLVATAIIVAGLFSLNCLTRADLTVAMPAGNTLLHLVGYGLVTALWTHYGHLRWPQTLGRWTRVGLTLAVPVALLAAIEFTAWTLGKAPAPTELAAAGAGVLVAALSSGVAARCRPIKTGQPSS